jgi:hypothetical protein
MAAFDYAGLTYALEAVLRDRLPDVDVAQDPIPVNLEHERNLRIQFVRFFREGRRVTSSPALGSPYDEFVFFTLTAWAHSGQSPEDAARLRDDVCRRAIDTINLALTDDVRLRTRVLMLDVLEGQALTGEGASIHSGLAMTLRFFKQT